MKVKLTESLSGGNFVFRARQVIECSEAAGKRLIDHGSAVQAPDSAEAEGALPESDPYRVRDKHGVPIKGAGAEPTRRPVETATAPGAEASREIAPGAEPEFCDGTTQKGNPCRRKPLPGTTRCAEHPLEG